MPLYSVRISKVEFYKKGGFSNSRLFRKQAGKGWRYFETIE